MFRVTVLFVRLVMKSDFVVIIQVLKIFKGLEDVSYGAVR